MVHRIADDADVDYPCYTNEQDSVFAEQTECTTNGNDRTYHGVRDNAAVFADRFVARLGRASDAVLAHLAGNVAFVCGAYAVREDAVTEEEVDLKERNGLGGVSFEFLAEFAKGKARRSRRNIDFTLSTLRETIRTWLN